MVITESYASTCPGKVTDGIACQADQQMGMCFRNCLDDSTRTVVRSMGLFPFNNGWVVLGEVILSEKPTKA